jgi:hypothetical protein
MTMGVAVEPEAMRLLRLGVPLSLLCDLLEPGGPASHEIYRRERGVPAPSAVSAPRVESALTRR